MTVRSLTPLFRISGIRLSGLPESPNPPDMIVMPSNSRSASAAAGLAYIFMSGVRGAIRRPRAGAAEIERKSVVEGKSGSVRVEVGGRRNSKKKDEIRR